MSNPRIEARRCLGCGNTLDRWECSVKGIPFTKKGKFGTLYIHCKHPRMSGNPRKSRSGHFYNVILAGIVDEHLQS